MSCFFYEYLYSQRRVCVLCQCLTQSEILAESLISLFNNFFISSWYYFINCFPLPTWNYSQLSFFCKSFLIKSNWNFSAANVHESSESEWISALIPAYIKITSCSHRMHPHHLREFFRFLLSGDLMFELAKLMKYSYHERFYNYDYFIAVRDKNIYINNWLSKIEWLG